VIALIIATASGLDVRATRSVETVLVRRCALRRRSYCSGENFTFLHLQLPPGECERLIRISCSDLRAAFSSLR